MKTLGNTLVETVDSFIRRSGRLNVLVEQIVSRVVPQRTVSACSGLLCYAQTVHGGPCGITTTYRYWAPSGSPPYPYCEEWTTCYDIVCG